MLAKSKEKVKKLDDKVQFPVYVQPKLDGYRCVAIYDRGWKLYSRNGKEYENFPQIQKALDKMGDTTKVYDGEIMSDDFQSMQRTAFAVKKKRTVGDVSYHVFDALTKAEWRSQTCKRSFTLRYKDVPNSRRYKIIKVPTARCKSWEDVYAHHALFKESYEGSIVRLDVPYEFKRTDSLMKMKEMLSQDCKVAFMAEGKGRLEGTLGKLVVIQEDGETKCEVGTGFSDEMRDQFWEANDLSGRIVEIKYQELTPDGVMRFPVFMRFRDDKD